MVFGEPSLFGSLDPFNLVSHWITADAVLQVKGYYTPTRVCRALRLVVETSPLRLLVDIDISPGNRNYGEQRDLLWIELPFLLAN